MESRPRARQGGIDRRDRGCTRSRCRDVVCAPPARTTAALGRHVDACRYQGSSPRESVRLTRRDVCRLTGLKPVAASPGVIKEWFLAGTEPTESAGRFFRTTDGLTRLVLPREYALWYRGPQNYLNAGLATDAELRIVSPTPNATFLIEQHLPRSQQALRLIASGSFVEQLTWTVDGWRGRGQFSEGRRTLLLQYLCLLCCSLRQLLRSRGSRPTVESKPAMAPLAVRPSKRKSLAIGSNPMEALRSRGPAFSGCRRIHLYRGHRRRSPDSRGTTKAWRSCGKQGPRSSAGNGNSNGYGLFLTCPCAHS